MKLNFPFFLIFLLSCTTRYPDNENKNAYTKGCIPGKTILADTISSNTEIIETFVDSLNIGEKGGNKIELIKHRVFEDIYIIVKFYTKKLNYWYLQNTYLYECDAFMSLEPNISDFNNDNFNDINFISATAARGANEVRLYITEKLTM